MADPHQDLQIAVIVPCRNEAASISNVVRDFLAAIPAATVFVYDNNSDDDTANIAREAGAVVRSNSSREKATSCGGCLQT